MKLMTNLIKSYETYARSLNMILWWNSELWDTPLTAQVSISIGETFPLMRYCTWLSREMSKEVHCSCTSRNFHHMKKSHALQSFMHFFKLEIVMRCWIYCSTWVNASTCKKSRLLLLCSCTYKHFVHRKTRQLQFHQFKRKIKNCIESIF
jgi:uncharacterized membrane protein